ncbi:hypothetical protein MTO96_023674 [Rhipicephalus appendiculatus]
MRRPKKPLNPEGSNSSLVTESSELFTEDATTKDDTEKVVRKNSLRKPTTAENVAPPANTRNSSKQPSRRSKGLALQEYHGQEMPSSAMDRSRKHRRQQEQRQQDYRTKRGGHAQAPAALVELDTEKHVQEQNVSNDVEEWQSARSPGVHSTACTTLVPRRVATAVNDREPGQSSVTVSEATTEYNAGENPDSLGMQDRHKPKHLVLRLFGQPRQVRAERHPSSMAIRRYRH